jgi:diaminohydroxyphosphoribosylaminopyrimidine deaminase/5-amino-6-(5-phosphoribosylamino)uracil reductase
MSLDGRTAMADGSSKWITGPAARADVQRLARAQLRGRHRHRHRAARRSAPRRAPGRRNTRAKSRRHASRCAWWSTRSARTPHRRRACWASPARPSSSPPVPTRSRERALAAAGATLLHPDGRSRSGSICRALLGHLGGRAVQRGADRGRSGAGRRGAACRAGRRAGVLRRARACSAARREPLFELPLASNGRQGGAADQPTSAAVGDDWRITATVAAQAA